MATKKEFSSFQDMLTESSQPLLVDFYAPWCGPCQMMAKILEQVHAQMKDRLQIVKINTDHYPDIATQYQVQALPTLVLFKAGRPVDRIEGVLPLDQLMQRLQGHV
ncbi:thioredoxin [Leptolyngbya sp. 'hensonii']|uniref:thioredoxin n=1 Tax=Leptolyngbya sp. 'hensonii' TaxID=1922337 RepID=UPI00094FA44E|nr:thioredoxin [Leptolyngbya sp. 'hensonii']OLP19060.1 thioredoxin [Leptolyngbya sp. 'hensonii']